MCNCDQVNCLCNTQRTMKVEIWEENRRKAKDFGVQRDAAFVNSKEAYQNGEKVKSRKYSDQVEHFTKLRDKFNKLAADEVFRYNNIRLPEHKIDLHNLFVREALEKLRERINELVLGINDKDSVILDVIVGKGIHSDNGPKIKPSVQKFAERFNIPCKLNDYNEGVIQLDLTKCEAILFATMVPDLQDTRENCAPKRKSVNAADFVPIIKYRKNKRTCTYTFTSFYAYTSFFDSKGNEKSLSPKFTKQDNANLLPKTAAETRSKTLRKTKKKKKSSTAQPTEIDCQYSRNEEPALIMEPTDRVNQNLNDIDAVVTVSESVETASVPIEHHVSIPQPTENATEISDVHIIKDWYSYCNFESIDQTDTTLMMVIVNKE